jgi:hypothetical protein
LDDEAEDEDEPEDAADEAALEDAADEEALEDAADEEESVAMAAPMKRRPKSVDFMIKGRWSQ